MGQRMADHFRLLVDLLGHEMPVVAAVDQQARGGGAHDRPLNLRAGLVKDAGAGAAEHRPVAIVEIGNAVGEGRQRDGVGAEIHLAVAVADGQRAAAAGADHEVVLALEDDGEGKGAAQSLQRFAHRLGRRHAAVEIGGDQVGDDFGVGLGGEPGAGRYQFLAQFAEVLDDAVMDQRHPLGGVRVGIALGRRAVGRPAGVADAGVAGERLLGELGFQVAQLALRAPAGQVAVFQRRHTGRVIAAIFQPLQRIDQERRHRFLTEDANDPAHVRKLPDSALPAFI